MTAADPPTTEEGPPSEEGPSGLSGAAHAAAWGFVYLVLRIFAVSDYDWDTAFLVSTTLGVDDGVALLLGSLMAGHLLTAILLVVVVPLLIAAQLWGPPEHRPSAMLLTTVGVVTIIALTVSFGSWWLPLATAAVFAAIAVIQRLSGTSHIRRGLIRTLSRASGVAGVALLVVAATVPIPWAPEETIETADGTVIGYVLSVDSGYLNVLTDEHEFMIILTSDVRSRR